MRTTDDTTFFFGTSSSSSSSSSSSTSNTRDGRHSNSTYSPASVSTHSINMKNYQQQQQQDQQRQQQDSYQEQQQQQEMMMMSTSMPMYYTSNMPMGSVNTSATTMSHMGMYSDTIDPISMSMSMSMGVPGKVVPNVRAPVATMSSQPQEQPLSQQQEMVVMDKEAQAKKKKADLAEMRRLRHLEIVRRGRAKKKKEMESMRNMVKELEAKTKFLSNQSNSNTKDVHSKGAIVQLQLQQQQQPQQQCPQGQDYPFALPSIHEFKQDQWSIQEMHQFYVRSMNETRCLRQENTTLKQKLVEFDTFAEQVKRFIEDFEIPNMIEQPCTSHTNPGIYFEPISEEVSYAILRQSYEEAMHFFTVMENTPSVVPEEQVMGWREHRRVNKTSIQFNFSKNLGTHVGVEALMRKSWEMYCDLHLYRGIYAFVQKLDILQRINDDTLVIRRDIQRDRSSPIFRTILLLFRIRTDTGYVICFRSHNPKIYVDEEEENPEQNVQWMECFYWLVLSNKDGDFGTNSIHGCDVKFGGTLLNDRNMKYANFWTLEIMMALLRWESNAIGGFIKVT